MTWRMRWTNSPSMKNESCCILMRSRLTLIVGSAKQYNEKSLVVNYMRRCIHNLMKWKLSRVGNEARHRTGNVIIITLSKGQHMYCSKICQPLMHVWLSHDEWTDKSIGSTSRMRNKTWSTEISSEQNNVLCHVWPGTTCEHKWRNTWHAEIGVARNVQRQRCGGLLCTKWCAVRSGNIRPYTICLILCT